MEILLLLPVIDTLVLSPLAFPENPYHRSVKDYKLVRESVNDPVADARQAAALFVDEFRSFEGLRQTEPGLFGLLYFVLATPEAGNDMLARGLERCFDVLGGTRPARDQALAACRRMFARLARASVAVDNWPRVIEAFAAYLRDGGASAVAEELFGQWRERVAAAWSLRTH